MKSVVIFFSLALAVVFLSGTAYSQNTSKDDVAGAVQLDPLREADAKHNLEVAWQYFTPKKAYKAVIMRFEETFAAYPEFSKIDEFLYLAGMSSLYLSENKGPQKIEGALSEKERAKYQPEKLKQDAMAYLSMLVDNHPKSKFKGDAEKALKKLKQ